VNVCIAEFEQTEGSLQVEEFPLNRATANYLKLVIESGYSHFVSVHKVHVDGVSGRDWSRKERG